MNTEIKTYSGNIEGMAKPKDRILVYGDLPAELPVSLVRFLIANELGHDVQIGEQILYCPDTGACIVGSGDNQEMESEFGLQVSRHGSSKSHERITINVTEIDRYIGIITAKLKSLFYGRNTDRS